jgi:hypothetical protein
MPETQDLHCPARSTRQPKTIYNESSRWLRSFNPTGISTRSPKR